MPGRRGKPSGVETSLGITTRPWRGSGSPPPTSSATRATAPRSADGPSQSTAAPPRRTSGKSHSVATGGGASAFATATPKRSVSCSSARPQTTSRFDSRSRQRSRKSTFRRSASTRVTLRSGNVAASGSPARLRRSRRPRGSGRRALARRQLRADCPPAASALRRGRGSRSARRSR